MDFKEAVIGIGFTGKQALQFLFRNNVTQCRNRGFRFRLDFGIVFQFRQLDHFNLIAQVLFHGKNGIDRRIQAIAFPHDILRLVRIVPEIRRFCKSGQFFEAQYCSIEVKETSSAVQPTA